jgi:hypothetical protein
MKAVRNLLIWCAAAVLALVLTIAAGDWLR